MEGGGTAAGSALPADLAAKVKAAMFSDACPFLHEAAAAAGRAFNLSQCRAFNGGVVTLGLAAVIDQVWAAQYALGDRQLRGQFIVGRLLQGDGWSVPRETFNYSAITCEKALGCDLDRVVRLPADGSALPPSPLSDPSYVGDHADGLSPGVGTVPNGSVPYHVSTELNHPLMDFLLEADATYLTPGLLYAAELYSGAATDSIDGFNTFVGTFVPTYVVIFVLCMATMFTSMVQGTNKDIQTKRSMLLYLPVAVVARVKTIRALIEDILATDADGAGLGNALMTAAAAAEAGAGAGAGARA